MGAAALAMVLGAAIAVRGAARCPTAAEVADALAALSPPGGTPATGDWADLSPDGDSVRVRLLQADGTLLAEKRLAPGSCSQQAETAAVVLAAWASQFHPEIAFSFDTPPPPARLVAERGPPALAAVPAPPAPRDPDPLLPGAGAGVLASMQGDSFAPAGVIEARLAARSGWGGKLAFRATGPHRATLGPGEAVWRRLGVSAGVLRRQAWRRLSVEAGAEVVSGVLLVEGDGYSMARRSRSLDLGAELGARVGLTLGPVEPWLGAGVCGWLRPQLVEVAGIADRDRLPAFDARVGIGANVAFGP